MSYWKNLETRRWCAVDMARRNLSGNRRPAWLIEYWFNNKNICFYFRYRLSILEFLSSTILSNACNPKNYRSGGNEHEVFIGFAKKYLFIKVEKNLKDSLDSIPSPVKIQIMGGKVCFRCKGKTLLGDVNKLFVFKSFLATLSTGLAQQCFALLPQ